MIREWGINMLLGAGMLLGVVLVVAGAMCVVDAVSSVVAEVWTWAFGGHL